MGSSPLTSVPVTGCGLQGTLSVPGRGTSHFLLPLPWVGLGAQGRQVALGTGVCRDRAPGASFRLLFLLSSGRSGGVPRSSCPKGSPPRARPGGGGREQNPNTGRPRDRQRHPMQGSRPAYPGGHRQGRDVCSGCPGAPAPERPRPSSPGSSLPRGWRGVPRFGRGGGAGGSSPKYTSLSHLGHLGMAAAGPMRVARLQETEELDCVGPAWCAPFRDPGTPPL